MLHWRLKINSLLAIGVLLTLFGACGRPDGDPALTVGVDRDRTLLSGGIERGYRLHLPPKLGEDLPLIISLHGLGGSATSQEVLSKASRLADQESYIIVYPEGQVLGRTQAWRVGPNSPDVVFIRDLVSDLRAGYAIHPGRIFIVGHSNGGGLVHRLACDAADLFSAAASVAGAYLYEQPCNPTQPIPFLAFHSLDDPVVPYGGSAQTPLIPRWAAQWARRNGCRRDPTEIASVKGLKKEVWTDCRAGAEVELYTLEATGHGWPSLGPSGGPIDATKVIWEFLNSHSRPRQDGAAPDN